MFRKYRCHPVFYSHGLSTIIGITTVEIRGTPEPELVSWIVIFMYIWDKITNIYNKGMRKRTKWKVMSSEMDPAEFRFMRKVVIKEWGAEIKKKIQNPRVPHVVRSLKVTAPSPTAVGYLETNC